MLPSEPSRTTTRLSTRIVRNGSSASRPRGSRSGSSSSRAVASRIVPARCSWPWSSTKPFGRKNSNSVCSPFIGAPVLAGSGHLLRCANERTAPQHRIARCAGSLELLLAFHVLHGERDLLDHDRVAAGIEIGGAPLARPGVLEVPPVDLVAGEVVDDDRTALALDLAVEHRLVPLQ